MQANGQRKLPLNSGSVRAGYGLRLGPQVFPLQWLAAETRDWRASGWLAEGGIALFRVGIASGSAVPFRNQAGAQPSALNHFLTRGVLWLYGGCLQRVHRLAASARNCCAHAAASDVMLPVKAAAKAWHAGVGSGTTRWHFRASRRNV